MAIKPLTAVFLAACLGGAAYVGYQDRNFSTFNPLRDRLEEQGLLGEAKADPAVQRQCDTIGAYASAYEEKHGKPYLNPEDIDVKDWLNIHHIYECHAAGHGDFTDNPFNDAYLGLSVFTEADVSKKSKQVIAEVIEENIKLECKETQAGGGERNSSLQRLCSAYGYR